ncbi:MAG: Universal stress protein [Methanosaeta sp. PtaB.Bin039]|nr:MAG: Universal stress protein [Methanosaeta sp. PtaB.Bin039]OPY47165.1 MAG: Universal stress protein [Methanosaeta sp. PtaU1.Bin028]HOT06847.1 universal stress protein [Methanotrichaceae archaeon]HQF16743.1 universal stress protein [Methanotrichaceae archaeon]HQI91375.1 universal stress protein [Methanotrichaceae archaeon]
MFEKIIIATDGSETSEKAAQAGIELARAQGAKVVALYVADTGRLSHLPDDMVLVSIKELLIKEGEEATGYVCGLAEKAGVACERKVVEGRPSDQILKYCREVGAQLLVMGSVGRSGLDRFLLGSVAEKVVQHAHIPVMTVPGERKGD